jgi:anti-sigma factor RsiW
MKPCPGRKKSIALLALNSLDTPSARELQAHLETCPGCRHYLAEMSRVVTRIGSAASATDLSASEAFHRQVMHRIKSQTTASIWDTILDSLRPASFNWRVALPVVALLIILLALGIMLEAGVQPRSTISTPQPSLVAVRPVTATTVNLAPTLANYQQAASQSLDKLDDLLVRETRQTGGSAQVCTASAMALNF